MSAAVAELEVQSPESTVQSPEAGGKKVEGRGSRVEDVTCSVQPLKLAIVGRPNVGKSSIINALTRSERVVVSPIPGTTRDAVDVPFTVETEGLRQQYVLIDTAGMRKTRRVEIGRAHV